MKSRRVQARPQCNALGLLQLYNISYIFFFFQIVFINILRGNYTLMGGRGTLLPLRFFVSSVIKLLEIKFRKNFKTEERQWFLPSYQLMIECYSILQAKPS